MLALVIGYVVGGAFLFQTLEQSFERQNCELGQTTEKTANNEAADYFINLIYFNISTNPILDMYSSNETNLDGPEIYGPLIEDRLIELRDVYLSNSNAPIRYYGSSDCPSVSLWSPLSAVLWALTVVSTLGKCDIFLIF